LIAVDEILCFDTDIVAFEGAFLDNTQDKMHTEGVIGEQGDNIQVKTHTWQPLQR
jgi:hypothetical protein